MISQNLKRIRVGRGLSQDRLSKLADIPYATITKIEAGAIKNPTIRTTKKIATALGVSLEELVF